MEGSQGSLRARPPQPAAPRPGSGVPVRALPRYPGQEPLPSRVEPRTRTEPPAETRSTGTESQPRPSGVSAGGRRIRDPSAMGSTGDASRPSSPATQRAPGAAPPPPRRPGCPLRAAQAQDRGRVAGVRAVPTPRAPRRSPRRWQAGQEQCAPKSGNSMAARPPTAPAAPPRPLPVGRHGAGPGTAPPRREQPRPVAPSPLRMPFLREHRGNTSSRDRPGARGRLRARRSP